MSDFEDEDCSEVEDKFSRAAEHLQKIHSTLSSNDLLEFYALYKQSTVGKCNISKPGLFNTQARAKWHAWNKLEDLDKYISMERYIEKINDISPEWDESNKTSSKDQWISVSVMQQDPEEEVLENDKTAVDYIKDNNLDKVKQVINKEVLNTVDDSGMGLIHWAADHNAPDILEFLITTGADINLCDSDGQTALHYASSCEHLDCVKLLLKFGADRTILDNDQTSCLDVAFDIGIRKLLRS